MSAVQLSKLTMNELLEEARHGIAQLAALRSGKGILNFFSHPKSYTLTLSLHSYYRKHLSW